MENPNEEPQPNKLEVNIDWEFYQQLKKYGILPNKEHSFNIGASDYSKRFIQPWHIWQIYNLNPWDADIVKRVLRNKTGEPRSKDYEKIIHDCEERLRQLKEENDTEI